MKSTLVLDPTQLPERDRKRLRRERHSAPAPGRRQAAATRITVEVEGGEAVVLPSGIAQAVTEALAEVAAGRKVYLTLAEDELTTQQAADLLGVSRPHVVRLLEAGQMPFRKVGSHRRVERAHVEAYREQVQRERTKALDALAAEAQALGLGY